MTTHQLRTSTAASKLRVALLIALAALGIAAIALIGWSMIQVRGTEPSALGKSLRVIPNAQAAFHRRTGTFSPSMEALGTTELPAEITLREMTADESTFVAVVDGMADGVPRRCTIRGRWDYERTELHHTLDCRSPTDALVP